MPTLAGVDLHLIASTSPCACICACKLSRHDLAIRHKMRFAHHKCRSSAVSPVVSYLEVHRDLFLRHSTKTWSSENRSSVITMRARGAAHSSTHGTTKGPRPWFGGRICPCSPQGRCARCRGSPLHQRAPAGARHARARDRDQAKHGPVAAGMRRVDVTTVPWHARQHESGLANGTGLYEGGYERRRREHMLSGCAHRQENEEATQAPFGAKRIDVSAHSLSQARRG